VYFEHNRVESIYEPADRIREMSPKAHILIGHGQMPESELERIMLAFSYSLDRCANNRRASRRL
jgi:transcription-repair coupling factor (superfamily II helicase)